ncbi:MAG: NmrA family NAD(P)-binding protein, partial [Candidatus Latescibacterota bacterium]
SGSSDQLANIRGENVETALIEYRDPDSMSELFRDISDAYLVTPFSYDLADMMRNLTVAARTFNVKHIVMHSVMGAENPSTIVAHWHRKAEQYLKASGIAFTFLRPNFVMQDFLTRQGESIRTENRIVLPLGDARVSYVDARDVAACAVECLTGNRHHGEAFTLTGPEALTVSEAADILSDVLGRRIEYVSPSEDDIRRGMAQDGIPGWLIEAHLDRHERYRVGNIGAEVTSAVKDITGRSPHSFRVFAETFADKWLAVVEV